MGYAEKFVEVARKYMGEAGEWLGDGDILRAMGCLTTALDFLRIAKTDPDVRGDG